MSDPGTPQKAPFKVAVESGKAYWWCACGLSGKQPFCDGSHKGSSFAPVRFAAEADGNIFFCGCKRTADQPRCDGTHKAL